MTDEQAPPARGWVENEPQRVRRSRGVWILSVLVRRLKALASQQRSVPVACSSFSPASSPSAPIQTAGVTDWSPFGGEFQQLSHYNFCRILAPAVIWKQVKSDVQLLRQYATDRDEAAFAEIVARHKDLVFSAAARQTRSREAAGDVAQSAFTALARAARDLAFRMDMNASLAGWLCRCTRNIAANARRDEYRRRMRERRAAEEMEPSEEARYDWERMRLVLDDAMAELNERDYNALVLRFFKQHNLMAVGSALGISEDAAQKRVSRALEKLRARLARRGVLCSTAGIASAMGANSVRSAPLDWTCNLAEAGVALGEGVETSGWMAAFKFMAMNTTQKVVVSGALALTVGTIVFETQRRQATAESEATAVPTRAALTAAPTNPPRTGEDFAGQIASLEQENQLLRTNLSELLRLRDEVTRLRREGAELRRIRDALHGLENESAYAEAQLTFLKIHRLKEWQNGHPEFRIPEFAYLEERNWIEAVAGRGMEGPYDGEHASRDLREAARSAFAHHVQNALKRFVEDHGVFPASFPDLSAYFKPPLPDGIAAQYAVIPSGSIPGFTQGEWIVVEVAPPFDRFEEDGLVWAVGVGVNDKRRVRRKQLPAELGMRSNE